MVYLPALQVPAPPSPIARLDRHTKVLDYLQALRGIGALMVVLFHGSRFISPYGEGLGFRLFGSGGQMGVDLFFVISGFIMVHTTSGPNASAKDFAIKRFSRIWPVYVAISLAYALHGYGWGILDNPEAVRRLTSTVLMVPIGNTDAVVISYPALPVGWTLNYEVYFYLVFGLSLLFGRWRWVAFFGWIGLSLLAVPFLVGSVPSISPLANYGTPEVNYGFTNGLAALATNPLVWLFVAGVVIGLINRTNVRLPAFWASVLAASALSIYAFQYASGWQAQHNIAQGGLIASVLVLALVVANKTVAFHVPRQLVLLGNVSFSLYLLHPWVQERTEASFVANGWGDYARGFSFLFLTTAIAIVLAAISYRVLERGLGEWVKRRLQRQSDPPTACSGSAPGNEVQMAAVARAGPVG
jgi:peptidoglycan/LPS O-acetylase OafA/YrhL